MQPLVSIIIPVYNGANYMKEAIDSAIAQTYKNIEIIVVNDGSIDDGKTEEIALQYGDKIRYFKKENGGSSSALNYGILKMNGQFFSWLSHDDVYMPDKIEKQIQIASQYADQDLIVVCDSVLINGEGKTISSRKSKIDGSLSAKDNFELLVRGHNINGCAVLLPKRIIDKVGFFDEEMVYLNDLDYWYRTTFCEPNFLYINNQLVKNRIHSQQVSVKRKNMLDIEKHYLVHKAFKLLREMGTNKQFFVKQLLFFCVKENLLEEKKQIISWLKQSNDWSGFEKRRLVIFAAKSKVISVVKKIRRKIIFGE